MDDGSTHIIFEKFGKGLVQAGVRIIGGKVREEGVKEGTL
jgi:hypothetical protein